MHGTLPRGVRVSKAPRPTSRPRNSDPQPIVFRDIAKLAFPYKTIEALGHLTKAGRSTIKDWLNGSHQPPGWVMALVFAEVMRRIGQRP